MPGGIFRRDLSGRHVLHWRPGLGDDPVLRDANTRFQESVPGAEGQPHWLFPSSGHFLTEDIGPELAEVLLAFLSQPSRGLPGCLRRVIQPNDFWLATASRESD
jgi:hypothetical protein